MSCTHPYLLCSCLHRPTLLLFLLPFILLLFKAIVGGSGTCSPAALQSDHLPLLLFSCFLIVSVL
jgi:hypothetical protein